MFLAMRSTLFLRQRGAFADVFAPHARRVGGSTEGAFSQSFQFAGVIYWYRFRCRHINLLLLLMAVARPIVIRKSAEQYTYIHPYIQSQARRHNTPN